MSPIEVAHSLPTGAAVATVAAEGDDLGSAVRAWAISRGLTDHYAVEAGGPSVRAAALPDPLAHPRRRAVRARLHPPGGRARRARRRPPAAARRRVADRGGRAGGFAARGPLRPRGGRRVGAAARARGARGRLRRGGGAAPQRLRRLRERPAALRARPRPPARPSARHVRAVPALSTGRRPLPARAGRAAAWS